MICHMIFIQIAQKKLYHNIVQPMCNLCVMMDLQKISTGLRIRGPKMD